jgi:para-nitrobenzyl esterase
MRTTATTTSGPVRGTTTTGDAPDDVVVFRGIPYAAPPVGDLRWRAPRPPAPWTTPRDATVFGPSAPQPVGGMLDGLVPGMAVGAIDEDCLTLNVWTPAVDAGARPVLVWLHGGAFTIGGSSLESYDGARLAVREDVVVVSCNYRLGALGFLLVDHPGADANCGLLDQIAALRWVQENITAFGGDPGRVAVFGESAGAGSVLSLLSTERSQGLFHAAIVQSGATDLVLTRERALAVTDAFATAAGVAAADIDALRALAVDDVIAAQQAAAQRVFGTVGMMPFHPTVDGTVMVHDWLGAAKAGVSRDVGLVIGTTRDEMDLFHSLDPAAASLDDASLRQRLERVVANPDALVEGYRAVDARASAPAIWAASVTDKAMWLPALRVAEAHAVHQPDTWMYRFDWPAADPKLGACHGIDIPFPFDTIDRVGWDAFVADPDRARALARAEQAAWAAVARTGAPTTDALPTWPRFDIATRSTMVLDGTPRVERDPRGPVREAWAAASTVRV